MEPMLSNLCGSQTKALLLTSLSLKGGQTGRGLALAVQKSPSQVFKALDQLVAASLVIQDKKHTMYRFNPNHPFFEPLVKMIYIEAFRHPGPIRHFYKVPPPHKRVDPFFVYEVAGRLKNPKPSFEKFSHALKHHAG